MGPFPLLKLCAGVGYQGPQFQGAVGRMPGEVSVEIAKRSDEAKDLSSSPKGFGAHIRLTRKVPTARKGLGMPVP